jgi:hypothetical protein
MRLIGPCSPRTAESAAKHLLPMAGSKDRRVNDFSKRELPGALGEEQIEC